MYFYNAIYKNKIQEVINARIQEFSKLEKQRLTAVSKHLEAKQQRFNRASLLLTSSYSKVNKNNKICDNFNKNLELRKGFIG